MQTTPHMHPANGATQASLGDSPDAHSLDEHAHPHGARSFDHTQVAPSRVTIAGHPIHPMLIPFPIAALLGTLVAILPPGGRVTPSGRARASG